MQYYITHSNKQETRVDMLDNKTKAINLILEIIKNNGTIRQLEVANASRCMDIDTTLLHKGMTKTYLKAILTI